MQLEEEATMDAVLPIFMRINSIYFLMHALDDMFYM